NCRNSDIQRAQDRLSHARADGYRVCGIRGDSFGLRLPLGSSHRNAHCKSLLLDYRRDSLPRGENIEEAKLIGSVGPMVWLQKKLMNDIGNWTFDDTQEFAKCLGWRARLWFNAEERMKRELRNERAF